MAEYIEREAVLAEIENDYKGIEKIKTPFAQIVVGGTAEKPYYSIMWWGAEKKECNIGYSSYCLDYVFKWLEVVFEVAEDAFFADVAPVVHGEWTEQHHDKWDDEWDDTIHWYTYECSKCGAVTMSDFPYCPFCGADMRERNGDE